MTKLTINLPATFDVMSRGKSVTVDINKLTTEIVEKLVLHGLTQKIADAAAGAKAAAGDEADADAIAAVGKSLMQKVVDNLTAGNWGAERGNGSAVDPVMAEIRILLRGKVKAKRADWKSLDEAARIAAIDETFAKQSDEVKAALTKAAEAEIRRKAQAKKVAGEIAIEI